MKWDCDGKIDLMFLQVKHKLNEYIEMLYIQNISNCLPTKKKDINKKIDEKLIENYLKKRGYVMNTVLNKKVWTNGFVVVNVESDYVEVWHDIGRNNKSVFVNSSLLTGLPITLNYMEQINSK